jgi:hypothetical protein
MAVVAGWQLQASADLVRDDLTLAKQRLGQASTAGPAPLAQRQAALQAAQQAITDARAQLRSWPLRQLSAVPVLGRDVRLASAAAAAAEQTAGAAMGVREALTRMESGRLTGSVLTASADPSSTWPTYRPARLSGSGPSARCCWTGIRGSSWVTPTRPPAGPARSPRCCD